MDTLIRTVKGKIFFAVILLLVAAIGVAFFLYAHDTQHVITLTDNGFSPDSLTISEGDTVTFVTDTGEAFWPASNVHPTHEIYPEFDPRKPMSPDSSWSHTFTKSGTYAFHDHINALYRGTIIVEAPDGQRASIDCSTQRNEACWERLMLETLREEGVAAAFEVLRTLSQTEPNFTRDCHGISHLIGEKAYDLYTANENFEITPATALCGYGFYHGFMETLLLTTGNIADAREFCSYVDNQLQNQAAAAGSACYHGSGHGAVDGSDPTAWGDIDAMMEPGFVLCDKLAQTQLQSYLCDTGVFNAIEILSRDPKYQITHIHEDPFTTLCNEQPLERREGCYSNMLPILFYKYKGNFDAIFAYINEHMIDANEPAIDGHDINGLVTLGVMFEFIRMYGGDPDYMQRGVELCRKQPAEDHLPCIEGLSGGHLKYGPPDREYVKNLEFCALTMLTEEERDACYQYLLPRVDGRYGEEKAREICGQVALEYAQRYCRYY